MRTLRASFFAISVLGASAVLPQTQDAFELRPEHCCAAEAGQLPAEAFAFEPTDTARELLRDILSRVGVPERAVEIRASDVATAVACLDPLLGRRMILYNEDFLRRLTDESQSIWAARAILAHELGHHLNGDLHGGGGRRRRGEELEADTFAGHVLFSLGATRGEVADVFAALKEGEHYPRSEARVAAATNGWLKAEEQSPYGIGGNVPASDSAVVFSDREQALQPAPGRTVVSDLALLIIHNTNVRHSGGGSPGIGMELVLRGRLEHRNAATVQVFVHFSYADGSALRPHPNEGFYYLSDRGVGTAAAPMSFSGGELDLSAIRLEPVPYYVLNLVSTEYETIYKLMSWAVVYVDGSLVGQTTPVVFDARW